jgi:hypothetical protein
MAEEQSSLQQALNSIMGWPGGQTQGTQTQGPVQLAPKSNLETTSALSNVVPPAAEDPFQAELDAIKAQNDALSASLAVSATPAAAAPAATTTPAAPAPYKPSYTMPLQDYMNYIYDFNAMERQAAGATPFSGKYNANWGSGTMVDPKTGQSISSRGTPGSTYLPADYNPNIAWVPPK